jgi:uncharacterized protein (TIGR02466 family)
MEITKNIAGLFPTPVAIVEHFDCGQQIRDLFNTAKILDVDDESQYQNRGRISENRYILNEPEYEEFGKQILDTALDFAKHAFAYEIEALQFTQSWITVKQPMQEHHTHSHGNSVISGVYYFNDGPMEQINFHKNVSSPDFNIIVIPTDEERAKDSPFATNMYTVYPKQNMMLLFPSYLRHSVSMNSSNVDRKCIAFNMIPIKQFGSFRDSTELVFNNLK